MQIAEKSKNFPEIDLKFNPVLCRKEQNCKVGESLEWFCEHRAKRPRQREEEKKEEEKKKENREKKVVGLCAQAEKD